MRTDIEAKQYYAVDDTSAACVHMIRSFARDTDLPIAFIHYRHGAHAHSDKRYKRKNDFSTVFIFVQGGIGFLFEEALYTPSFGEAILVREKEPFSVFGTKDL